MSAASRRALGYLGVSALALVLASLHVVFGSMDASLAPQLVSLLGWSGLFAVLGVAMIGAAAVLAPAVALEADALHKKKSS